MEFDSALSKIGDFGHYQRVQYIIVNIIAVPLYFQYLIGVFIAAQPQWICTGEVSSNPCRPDGTVCPYARYTSNFTSIATEWNLVCSSAYKSELAQSVLMAGFLVGGLFGGYAADRYGRRKIWVTCIIASSIFGLLSAFATSLNTFFVLRFLHGIFIQGGSLVTFVLSTEMIGPSYRAFAGMIIPLFSAVGFVLLAWLASIFRNWRTLLVVAAAPQLVSVFFMHLVPESPRWLLLQGRKQDAEDILNEAGRVNGVSNPNIVLKKIKGVANTGASRPPKSASALTIFRRKSIRTVTMVLLLSFVASGIGYFGISLNVRHFGGDMYVNFALAGLVEIPSYILGIPLLERLGRRRTNFLFTFGAAISCWCCMKFQQAQVVNSGLVTCTALIGKFCVSATSAVLYIYAAELFPTVVRNMALGICSVCSRIGSIVSPFIVLLGNENKSLPMLIISVVTIIAAIAGLFLPETQGKPMPQTFKDLADTPPAEASIYREPMPL